MKNADRRKKQRGDEKSVLREKMKYINSSDIITSTKIKKMSCVIRNKMFQIMKTSKIHWINSNRSRFNSRTI